MDTELKRRIEEHARSSSGHEVCGFVYSDRYVPLRNLSADPHRFQADPKEVAAALAQYGEPAAVFHTHPHGPAQPSAADLGEYYYISSNLLIGTFGADGTLILSSTKAAS